jgi:RHS repeat-associated protein
MQETKQTWNYALGVATKVTDPNNLDTEFAYDNFARLIEEKRPDQTRTVWSRSTCSSGCDARTRYRLYQYDRDTANSTYRTTISDIDQFERAFKVATQLPSGSYSVTNTEFDARGRTKKAYVPYWSGGSTDGDWRYSYDLLDRILTRSLYTAGGVLDRSMSYAYSGLVTTMTNARSHVTRQTRTAWGDVVRSTDAGNNTTSYQYNGFGQLTQVVDALSNVVSSVTYNVRGMKTSQTDLDMGAWTYLPNALGELAKLRDAKTASPNWTTIMTYDVLSRMTSRQDVAEGVTSYFTFGTSVNDRNIGRLQSMSGGGYSETFIYDDYGRLETRGLILDNTYEIDYAYNSLGKLHTLTYPAAYGVRFKTKYGYSYGYPTQVREYTGEVDGTVFWTLNSTDARGQPIDEALGTSNSVQIVSGFSPLTGLLEYRAAGPGGSDTLQNLAYEWDDNDNLVQRADLNQSGTCSGTGYSSKLCETFVYDGFDRLDTSQRNGVTNLDLAYDAIGNVTSKTSATETAEHIGTYNYTTAQAGCSYYSHSQRHAVRKAGSTVYCYDANGNLTSRGGESISWYSYNLPHVINGAGQSSEFWYTPDRRRWKQVGTYPGGTGLETTHYIGGVTEKLKRGSSTQYRNLIQIGSVQIIATRNSGGQTIRYLTTDALGSVDRMIDSAGASLANLSFSAFGSRRGSAWQGGPTSGDQTQIRNATRRGFTWHEHLDNVGLIHMNGRVYDPAIGRFASADPFVAAPYDSQGLNRYSYVGNNPLSRIDPSGFSEIVPKRLIGDPRIDESGSGMDSITVWGRRETVHTVRSGTGFSYTTGSGPTQWSTGGGAGSASANGARDANGGNPADVITVKAQCVNTRGVCGEGARTRAQILADDPFLEFRRLLADHKSDFRLGNIQDLPKDPLVLASEALAISYVAVPAIVVGGRVTLVSIRAIAKALEDRGVDPGRAADLAFDIAVELANATNPVPYQPRGLPLETPIIRVEPSVNPTLPLPRR